MPTEQVGCLLTIVSGAPMTKEILSVLETLEADEINYYFEQGTWRKFAACLGVKTDSFFPSEGADQEPLHSICVSCVAQSDCLTYAVLANEDHGFWGNTSERGRRGIRRRLRKTRPDLLRVGSQLAKRNRKGMKGNIAKAFAGVNDEVEPIDEGELMEHLLPKVRELLRRLAKHQGAVNAEQFLLSLNISPEAFAQRLNLARQMKWVSIDSETIKLTPAGKKLLFDSGTPVAIRIQQNQPTTPQEVFMASKEYEWLSDLDIEILQCLAAGEIEDGANASGILAEKIGAETGSSFSNRLKRLDDEGLIRRRVNGKRTNYLAITGNGSKALHQHGVSVSPSSNGSKPRMQPAQFRPPKKSRSGAARPRSACLSSSKARARCSTLSIPSWPKTLACANASPTRSLSATKPGLRRCPSQKSSTSSRRSWSGCGPWPIAIRRCSS